MVSEGINLCGALSMLLRFEGPNALICKKKKTCIVWWGKESDTEAARVRE